jgi:hypothetical protein
MESNDRILDDIRRLCDPYSLLVISKNRLIRIKCPFRVRTLANSAAWKEDEEFYVDKVMVTPDLLMIFIIDGNGFPSFLFRLVL